MPKLSVGFITYNDEKYLPYFLESLSKQTIIDDIEILCLDNLPKNSSKKIIEASRNKFPKKINFFQAKENMYFAPGHNFLMNKAKSPFYACMNNDMVFEPDCFERLLESFDKNTASVQPRLLQWDFTRNKKTERIDSTGIQRSFWSSFYERGHGEKDNGQYDEKTKIFGCTGAFVIYDLEKSKRVAKTSKNSDYIEYFDDSFKIYKEDVDLAWRLQNTGFNAKYVPEAIGWHDRTLAKSNASFVKHAFSRSKHHSDINRRFSTRNHLKMLKKNLLLKNGALKYLAGWIHEIVKFGFCLLFDWKMVREFEVIFRD